MKLSMFMVTIAPVPPAITNKNRRHDPAGLNPLKA